MSAPGPRRLVVVRHAKSEREPPEGGGDHDRVLSGRGRRDARALGSWLAAATGAPDLVLCSSAARARLTWQLAAEAFDPPPSVEERAELYLASPGRLLAAVRAVPADVGTLVVVGHEPVQSTLTQALAGPGSSATALTGLAAGFATSAVAVLVCEGPWEALQPHGARLVDFAVPRG